MRTAKEELGARHCMFQCNSDLNTTHAKGKKSREYTVLVPEEGLPANASKALVSSLHIH